MIGGGIGKNRNGFYNAGASQIHPHSQGIATLDFYPPWLVQQLKLFGNNLNLKKDSTGDILEGCPYCIEARFVQSTINVLERDNFFISYVNPNPTSLPPNQYEVVIASFNHQSRLDEITEEHAEYFTDILHKTMQTFSKLGDCGFNFVLYQGPWNMQSPYYNPDSFHWQFKIYPAYSRKTEKHDGFMSLILGVPVLTEPPEDLAGRLKS